MAVDSINQQTVRDALSALLQTSLTGGSNPVQAAFGYDAATFENQSPVITVKSGKSDRTPKFLGNAKAHVWFYFDVDVYVAVGDKNSPTWTDQNVENDHDLIEKKVADMVADNQRNVGVWDMLQYAQAATAPQPMLVSGSKFRKRTISLKARVIGG